MNPKDEASRGKVPVGNLPSGGVIHTALAIQNGAEKYGANNWRDTPIEAMTYIHALQRHVTAWVDREDNASDTGIHHLAHAAATLLIVLDAMECGTLIDNRPATGPAAKLLARLNEA